MKKKINSRMLLIAIFAIVFTAISIIALFYEAFQDQVREDLKIEANIMLHAGIENVVGKDVLQKESGVRITWIAADGGVLYDNDVAVGQLENHKDRPEVKKALESGTGDSDRKSDTLGMRTFYHAIRLEDGTIFRVATQARGIFSILVTVFPVIGLIILLLVLVCASISHVLTRQLLSPIYKMAENMEDHAEGIDETAYRELVPFLNKIRAQHEDILGSAKLRQDFTANVSHELKTPLTAISGYAELIENDMADEAQKKRFITEIRKNAERLLSLIVDIIRLSELDHKDGEEDFVAFDIYEVSKECMDDLRENARQKNVSIRLEGESVRIYGNREMIKEMIENLCQNAIRYNVDSGAVLVQIGQEQHRAFLRVSDTGIGIAKEHQERVFERFYRVDKSRSRATGGTGLGLAIVKHIAMLHDARIELESEVGKGTTITIRF